jgi:hypothetical protein
MRPTDFIDRSRDSARWRRHARTLRASADLLWENFSTLLSESIQRARDTGSDLDLESAEDALQTTKLLYGLALETALKAWIIDHQPEKVEIRVVMDGSGEPKHAELRALGVPTSSGHNILALAEAAGIFDDDFQHLLSTQPEANVLKNLCRELSDVVLWRGRYPVPLASGNQLQLDKNAPARALFHYLRDWLDPLLNTLLEERLADA